MPVKKNGFDGESGLFFEYARIFSMLRPEYFLLENVPMKKEYEKTITDIMGVTPVLIDSASFSAQSRKRLYWTNIPIRKYDVRNNTYLCDILESPEFVPDSCYLKNTYKLSTRVTEESRLAVLERNYRQNYYKYKQNPVLVSEVIKDTPSGRSRQSDRLYSIFSKSPTLTAASHLKIDMGVNEKNKWRLLTPVEFERLQTLPDNYTSAVKSESMRRSLVGNGWTINVLVNIFRGLTL